MKKQCSEGSQGDIKGFSNMIYKVLGVVIVFYPVIIATNILSEIWRIIGLTFDVIPMGMFDILLLRLEGSSAFIPATTLGITIFGQSPGMDPSIPQVVAITAALFVAHCVIMIGIFYLRAIFREMKSGVSPFCKKMVERVLSLAWIATFITIFEAVNHQNLSLTNITLLVTAWLMYYIFEHGRKLQDESDTTL